MNDSNNQPALPKYFPRVDALRGMAIIFVLLAHYFGGAIRFEVSPNSSFPILLELLRLGWSGVDLFFVLSGFLIGGILLDNKDAKNFFKVFYMRRICRILPLYFLLLLPFFICVYILKATWEPPRDFLFEYPLPIAPYFVFLQNFFMAKANTWGPHWLGITWTLAIEEQFYLLVPLIIRFVDRRKIPFVLVLLILLAILSRMVLFWVFKLSYLGIYVLLPCRMDSLFLGVLAAALIRKPWVVESIQTNRWFWRSATAILGAGILVFTLYHQGWDTLTVTIFGYTWFSTFYFFVLFSVLFSHNHLIRLVFENRVLRGIGLISYGIYLFHQLISGLLHGIFLYQAPQLFDRYDLYVTTLSAVVVVFLAAILHVFIEKPFINLGHRFKYEKC